MAWRAATLMREYRRSHSGIGLGDYLIAATALTEGLELATLNVRHYPCSRAQPPFLTWPMEADHDRGRGLRPRAEDQQQSIDPAVPDNFELFCN